MMLNNEEVDSYVVISSATYSLGRVSLIMSWKNHYLGMPRSQKLELYNVNGLYKASRGACGCTCYSAGVASSVTRSAVGHKKF